MTGFMRGNERLPKKALHAVRGAARRPPCKPRNTLSGNSRARHTCSMLQVQHTHIRMGVGAARGMASNSTCSPCAQPIQVSLPHAQSCRWPSRGVHTAQTGGRPHPTPPRPNRLSSSAGAQGLLQVIMASPLPLSRGSWFMIMLALLTLAADEVCAVGRRHPPRLGRSLSAPVPQQLDGSGPVAPAGPPQGGKSNAKSLLKYGELV